MSSSTASSSLLPPPPARGHSSFLMVDAAAHSVRARTVSNPARNDTADAWSADTDSHSQSRTRRSIASVSTSSTFSFSRTFSIASSLSLFRKHRPASHLRTQTDSLGDVIEIGPSAAPGEEERDEEKERERLRDAAAQALGLGLGTRDGHDDDEDGDDDKDNDEGISQPQPIPIPHDEPAPPRASLRHFRALLGRRAPTPAPSLPHNDPPAPPNDATIRAPPPPRPPQKRTVHPYTNALHPHIPLTALSSPPEPHQPEPQPNPRFAEHVGAAPSFSHARRARFSADSRGTTFKTLFTHNLSQPQIHVQSPEPSPRLKIRFEHADKPPSRPPTPLSHDSITISKAASTSTTARGRFKSLFTQNQETQPAQDPPAIDIDPIPKQLTARGRLKGVFRVGSRVVRGVSPSGRAASASLHPPLLQSNGNVAERIASPIAVPVGGKGKEREDWSVGPRANGHAGGWNTVNGQSWTTQNQNGRVHASTRNTTNGHSDWSSLNNAAASPVTSSPPSRHNSLSLPPPPRHHRRPWTSPPRSPDQPEPQHSPLERPPRRSSSSGSASQSQRPQSAGSQLQPPRPQSHRSSSSNRPLPKMLAPPAGPPPSPPITLHSMHSTSTAHQGQSPSYTNISFPHSPTVQLASPPNSNGPQRHPYAKRISASSTGSTGTTHSFLGPPPRPPPAFALPAPPGGASETNENGNGNGQTAVAFGERGSRALRLSLLPPVAPPAHPPPPRPDEVAALLTESASGMVEGKALPVGPYRSRRASSDPRVPSSLLFPIPGSPAHPPPRGPLPPPPTDPDLLSPSDMFLHMNDTPTTPFVHSAPTTPFLNGGGGSGQQVEEDTEETSLSPPPRRSSRTSKEMQGQVMRAVNAEVERESKERQERRESEQRPKSKPEMKGDVIGVVASVLDLREEVQGNETTDSEHDGKTAIPEPKESEPESKPESDAEPDERSGARDSAVVLEQNV